MTAAISDHMGVILENVQNVISLISPGRGLLLHSSSFYSVGVRVQVGADLSVQCMTHTGQSSGWLHHWHKLCTLHSGVWPLARVLRSMIHTRNIPPQPQRFSISSHQRSARDFSWMCFICSVHQPSFKYCHFEDTALVHFQSSGFWLRTKEKLS